MSVPEGRVEETEPEGSVRKRISIGVLDQVAGPPDRRWAVGRSNH